MKTEVKVVTPEEAALVIKDGDTVATNGFIGIGVAEEILIAIEKRYVETQTPKNLTLMYAAGQGDAKDRGENHFGHDGMLKRVVGGHWGLVPKVQKMALQNKIEAYNFPQGVISQMYRDIAGKRPRTIVKTGLHTFVDPRLSGGKINEMTKEELVELIEFDGQEYLSYKTFPIDIAIIRGTTADTDGNVSMEKEALNLEALAMAMAARNSGGKVIVQVERLAEKNSLYLQDIIIPGIMVDYIVLSKPENHHQTFAEIYNPSYSGEIRIPLSQFAPMEMSVRKIIVRRAVFELSKGDIVNLGLGIPERVASIAAEERIFQDVTLTAEPGVIGGVPANGLSFGASANVNALISQPSQFDFYDGGGLDIAFLGLAQADQYGNLNVSRFGPRYPGAGGFINISQFARKVVFLGTFTAVGLKVSIVDGKLVIDQEGKEKKFVKDVEHITFSGKYAQETGKPVLYVTERCVFKLGSEGMELVEIAPGIEIEKHILPYMDFEPIINKTPKLMEERIFREATMKVTIS
ncbi:acyl CoA:acetate/3-ketoacid CoA transferase, partial [bacterium]|nr:acyl CoA:acetate/3-ketoacid CoA transferase [bacterium]